jgi:hypothetical protein
LGSEVSGKQERRWRNMTVDANLRDEWLVDLNRMCILELRSICEGHVARVDPLSRNAHITTVVNESLQPFFHRHWDELRESISGLLGTCFCRDDARVRVEATRELTLNPGSQVHAREALFIEATKRHARRRREIDDETVLWLERTVAVFLALDEGLLALYEHGSGGGPVCRRRNQPAHPVRPE